MGLPIPQGIDFDAVNGYRLACEALSAEGRGRARDRIVATLEQYGCAVAMHLSPDDSMSELYHSTDKLVGLFNAIAESNAVLQQLEGRDLFLLEGEWRSKLYVVAWQ